ncbi:MAG: hypothetical protein KGI29_05335 [Pseudomonadota bacterium]|nr:hypothetical protein [Pseudomonadota bacterium]MDE3038941.1 hypothetical protein [Pseudomonadota bacterium]
MDFDAVITGDRRIIARFGEWPKELHDSLLARIRALTDALEGRVQALAPERTGKLKSEITSRLFDDPQKIKGMVTLDGGLSRSEYIKAAALEYGAHGGVKVRSYSRTIAEAFGRDISPARINVSAYSRITNIEARVYLRGGLADVEAEATAELQQVIDQSTKEFSD